MKATKWVKVQIVEYRSIYVEVLDDTKDKMGTEAGNFAFECGSSGWEVDDVKIEEIASEEPSNADCRRWDIEKYPMDASDKQDDGGAQ